MPRAKGVKQVAANRKALHDYFVLERFEAGVELFGTEVKSIRAGTVNLKDSFCTVKNGELFAYGIHISPYEHGSIYNRDPDRPKRLLMHRRDSRVKVELGLCKGKKLYDKRDADAQRSAKREIDRTIKEKNY